MAFRIASLAIAALLPMASAAQEFRELILESPYPLIQPVFAADVSPQPGREILLLGRDEQGRRHLLVYGLDPQGQQLVALDDLRLPDHYHSVDFENAPGQNRPGLYFVSHNSLARYQPGPEGGALQDLASIAGLVLQPEKSQLARGRLVQDLNGDQALDFAITGFNSLQLLISQADGSLRKSELPIAAQMVAEYGRVSYSDAPVFYVDANNDGRTDVVAAGDGQLQVFTQSDDGQFAAQPFNIAIRKHIYGQDWWHKRDDNGEEYDQSQLQYRKLDRLRDINADGWPDLLVRYTRSQGVLERSNDYEIYLGRHQDGLLHYGDTPDSAIRAGGTLTGLELLDTNHDGRLEVSLSRFDIGLGQIIGALLSGSIDQQVYLYRLNDADHYGESPAASYTVDLKFSLSKGQSGSAVVKLADVDGDGLKDLLLSTDTDTLRIYRGQDNEQLFAKNPQKFKTLLPGDGEQLQATDINLDGKADLLMRYGRLDKPSQARQIRLLMGN